MRSAHQGFEGAGSSDRSWGLRCYGRESKEEVQGVVRGIKDQRSLGDLWACAQ